MFTASRQTDNSEIPAREDEPLLGKTDPARRQIPTIVWVCVLMGLLEFEESVSMVPTVRLYESAVCHRYYKRPVAESECKIDHIQKKLAWIRGWQASFDSLPTLLFALPFGYLADQKGRRPVVFLSELGEICCLGWILMTCMLWNKMPVLVVWLSSLFRTIGGGRNVIYATIQTIAADISIRETRNRNFSVVGWFSLWLGVLGVIVAGIALKHSLWLPYLISITGLATSFPILYWMSETVPNSSETKITTSGSSFSTVPLSTTIKSTLSGFWTILKQRTALAGLSCIFLGHFTLATMSIIPQYTSYRFGIDLSETTSFVYLAYIVNIPVSSIIIVYEFLCIQSIGSLHNRSTDLVIARCGLLLLTIGALVVSVAHTETYLRIGLIIFAAGFWSRTALVSHITNFVDAGQRATFYSLIAIIEQLASFMGKNVVQIAWQKAIQWKGYLLGFPFMILTGLFFTAFFISMTLLGAQNSPMLLENVCSGEEDDEEEEEGT